jgi:hypothetical protein
MMIGLNFLDIFAQISRLDQGLNNYRYQSVCLLPYKIDLRKYLAVILSPSRPYILYLLFSWVGKHNVDSCSGGFGTSSLVQHKRNCVKKLKVTVETIKIDYLYYLQIEVKCKAAKILCW